MPGSNGHYWHTNFSLYTVCRILRAKFMADMLFFHIDQIIWLDKMGCDWRDEIRKFGYSLRGERPVYHHLLHRGNRISAITAMSTDGITAVDLFQEILNGDRYLNGTLIPEMDHLLSLCWFWKNAVSIISAVQMVCL